MRFITVLFCLVFFTVCVSAQIISPPTQTDQIIIDAGTPGSPDPNDRIRYTVTIQNIGGAPATEVQLSTMIDPNTTLVPGSFKTSPMAANDAYSATGNLGISVPAPGLKANDYDDMLASATLSCGTCMSANGGTVVVNNDGSFTYNPPPGFTGTDNFTYTMTDSDPVGGPVPTTDNGTVTITVTNLIWFINNSLMAPGNGTLASPFNSLAVFNANSTASADVVYIEHTGTDYIGGIVLQAGERLYGEGHQGGANLADVLPFSLAPNSPALPAINGSRPVITNAGGHGITLGTNNAIRGLEVGATLGAKISGNGFSTLTVGNTTTPDVLLSGNGQALNLNNGTFDATSQLISVSSTSSTSQGMLLQMVSGTVAFGSTTISGCSTQGILLTTSTANINFGNTTIAAATDGVSLQNNSAGTRTFGTLSITNGSGVGFLHAVDGGITTISGLTTITNPGGRGIDIQNASTAVTFANVNVTQSGGTGVYLQNNSGNITFAALDITPDANQRSLQGIDNTGTITATSGTVTNSGATGIEITRAAGVTPVNITLSSVTTNGGTNGIFLNNASGTFNVGAGTLAGSSGTGFLIQNGTATITYSGTISTSVTYAVDIDNHDSGNITFQTGNITNTGQGIRVQNSNGGVIAFNNPSKSLNTVANTAVNLSSNTGATINFGNGGLVINTTTGTGFNATGGGTINVTGTGNTIASVSAPAMNVVSTTIGSSNLNFLSISSGNNTAAADPANGIVLNTTGSSGGLIVTGTGTTDGSGGVIQNITNRGVSGTSTSNLSLKNMTFTNANMVDAAPCGAADNSGCNAAVYLNTVTTATLDNLDINGASQQGINLREVSGLQLLNSNVINGGAGGQTEESDLYALNLFGTCAITSCSLTVPAERAAVIYNTNKTLALTVTGSTFGMNQTQPLGADGLEVDSYGSSNTTLDIVNSTFVQPKTNGLQVITEGTSFSSVDVTGSTFDPGTGLAAAIDLVTNTSGDMDFNIVNNPMIKGKGINIVNIFAFPNSTFEGRINNNTVVHNGGSGSGIRVVNQGNGNSKVEVKNNMVTAADDYGITVNSNSGSGRLDATITGNTVSVSALGFYTIHAAAGASSSVFTNKVCANVANNTTTAPSGSIGNFQARAATATHEILLQGPGPNVTTNWNSNTNAPLAPPAIISQSGTGLFTFGATCTLPANPNP